jgi:hypothetical protein
MVTVAELIIALGRLGTGNALRGRMAPPVQKNIPLADLPADRATPKSIVGFQPNAASFSTWTTKEKNPRQDRATKRCMTATGVS